MSGSSACRFDLLPLNSPRRFWISSPSWAAPFDNSLRTSSDNFTPGGGTGRTFSAMLSAGPSANARKPRAAVARMQNVLRIGEPPVEAKARRDASPRPRLELLRFHHKRRVPRCPWRICDEFLAAVHVQLRQIILLRRLDAFGKQGARLDEST